ncbi:SseB family protein [Metabacillus indicus]|uniref:SseB family protein n=1 Tax=Metabacillus indicus TaxID=246786 RepID=UPI0031806E45
MSTPFNTLEKALIDAMSSNEKVADFYDVLKDSSVWLVQKQGLQKNSPFSLDHVHIMEKKQKKLIPVFSSEFPIRKMFQKNTAVQVPFRELLQMLDDQTGIILNPDTPLSKLLIPQELGMMKRGQNYFK